MDQKIYKCIIYIFFNKNIIIIEYFNNKDYSKNIYITTFYSNLLIF